MFFYKLDFQEIIITFDDNTTFSIEKKEQMEELLPYLWTNRNCHFICSHPMQHEYHGFTEFLQMNGWIFVRVNVSGVKTYFPSF